MNKLYYVSWSPKSGEATYTRCFTNEKEWDDFTKSMKYYNPQTWEREIK